MLLGLVAAALAEGIGISTLLPVFKMAGNIGEGGLLAANPDPGPIGEIERAVIGGLMAIGVQPTLGPLLSVIVGFMFLKASLVIVAKRQVGNTVARAATDLRLRLLNGLMAARWRYFTNHKLGIVTNAFATGDNDFHKGPGDINEKIIHCCLDAFVEALGANECEGEAR